MEVTVNVSNPFIDKMAKLLQQKDKLVGKDTGDGRNQYQIEVQKLKDKIKSFNKEHNLKGKKAHKFGNVLKMTKAAERRGEFDRGAEDKTKKKLRKKMMDERDFSKKGGVHAGTDADREAKFHQTIMDDPEIKKIKQKVKKQKSVHGSR